MTWKNQAKNRFSFSRDAQKWNNLYVQPHKSVEAISFRQRRDYTVQETLAYVTVSSQVLDLGCGSGPVLSKLVDSPLNLNLTGIDYSQDMLDLAAKNLPENRVTLRQGDCEHLVFDDDSFDCVICLGVISYAESIEKAFSEIQRILKPGGIAFVSYRNLSNEILLDPIALVKWLISGRFRSEMKQPKIGRSMPRNEVLENLQHCSSLKVIKEKYIGFGNLRLNQKTLSDGKAAIFCNSILDLTTAPALMHWIRRYLSDVHVLTIKKSTA